MLPEMFAESYRELSHLGLRGTFQNITVKEPHLMPTAWFVVNAGSTVSPRQCTALIVFKRIASMLVIQ